ncbi:MAG: RNA methyltransferase [Thermotogae bacterium]|nr:RNA methyltransferase [Thermotogota bacterium]
MYSRESKAIKPPGEFFAIAIVGGKTKENLGSILRLALNYGASAVFLVGCRYRRVPTDTLNTAGSLPVIECDELPRIVGVTHVYVELGDGCESLEDFKHPKRALYIVGPEDGTLTVPEGKKCVFVPTVGSLNQAMAVCTLLWDRKMKLRKEGL